MEKVSLLPSAATSVPNISVVIHDDGGRYRLYIQTSGGRYLGPHKIELTKSDLSGLNQQLQRDLLKVSKYTSPGGLPDDSRYTLALLDLAQSGLYAYHKVFPNRELRESLVSYLSNGAKIQIVSEDFDLPWELLYYGSPDTVDPSSFWGLRYVISRSLMTDTPGPSDFLPPTIHTQRPRVGLVTYDGLPCVVQMEVPTFKKWERQKRISLVNLQRLDPMQSTKGLGIFGRFLQRRLDILHTSCHAYEEVPPNQSYLLVNDDFPVTMQHFAVHDFTLKHSPLVILNACLTGTMSPLHTSNWAEVLWRHGARGVVATELQIPDWFAAAFTEELYEHLLSEMPIGDCLLASRRHFWYERGNPLGLAYALYGSPDFMLTS